MFFPYQGIKSIILADLFSVAETEPCSLTAWEMQAVGTENK